MPGFFSSPLELSIASIPVAWTFMSERNRQQAAGRRKTSRSVTFTLMALRGHPTDMNVHPTYAAAT